MRNEIIVFRKLSYYHDFFSLELCGQTYQLRGRETRPKFSKLSNDDGEGTD